MNRPEQECINSAGTQVERYIARLEQDLAIANSELNHIRKIMGVRDVEKLADAVQSMVSHALTFRKQEQEQLDKFACAALTGFLASFAGTETEVNTIRAAQFVYDQAADMLAESNRRQGGAQ